MSVSAKTKKAIAKYGRDACLHAFRMHHADGHGAAYIAFCSPYDSIKTTRQADAAIDAGRDIVNNDKPDSYGGEL